LIYLYSFLSNYTSLFSSISSNAPISTLFPYTTLFRSKINDDDDYLRYVENTANFLNNKDYQWSFHLIPRPFNFENHLDKTIDKLDRKSTRLNSSHVSISYAFFCLKKKRIKYNILYNLI